MIFPFPRVDLGITVVIRMAQHWGRRGAHLSESKGEKSEGKTFYKNTRKTVSVSTNCDEDCRFFKKFKLY